MGENEMMAMKENVTVSIRAYWLMGGVIAAVLAAGCDRSKPAQSLKNIFGEDNRVVLSDVPAISDAMVRLDSGCTGVFVGKGLVLTAAHCLVEPTQSDENNAAPELKAKESGFVVRAGVSKNGAEETFLAERAWLGSAKPEKERERDFAILLVKNQKGELLDHTSVDLAANDQFSDAVALVGFHSDRDGGRTLLATPNCSIRKRVGLKLFNDCDGTSGISGAPLFDQLSDQGRIVGLQVSEYRRGASESVKADTYSDELANVAVNVASFRQGVEMLRSLVAQETAGSYDGASEGLVLLKNPRPMRYPRTMASYEWTKIKSTSLKVSRGLNGFDLAFENTIDASMVRLEITTPSCREGVSSYQLMTIARPLTNEWVMSQPFDGVGESQAALMPIDQIKFLRLRWIYNGFDQESCSVDVYTAKHPQEAPDLLNPPRVEKSRKGWYCEAAPYDAPRQYRYGYWLSPSLDVSRYEAMKLCVQSYGEICTVQCKKR
jgi:V8-like Glu-specific endopeptidase